MGIPIAFLIMQENFRSECPIFFLIAVTLAGLLIPAIGTALPDSRHTDTIVTSRDLNVTNASFPDLSAVPEHRVTPEPLHVQVIVSETSLPAPKGEMGAGPRMIGVSIDPLLLAAGIILIMAAGIGMLYYVRRNRAEKNQE